MVPRHIFLAAPSCSSYLYVTGEILPIIGGSDGWPEKTSLMAEVRIGTSGWHYASWRGPFFPPGLKLQDQLRFYATQFSTTELNGVFYRTPTEAAVKGWRAQTPDGFIFAWKASKFITHWKRLSERSENSLALLESRVELLGDKAGQFFSSCRPSSSATTNA